MQTRFNTVGIVMGKRGTGKTLFVLGSKHSAKAADAKLNILGIMETELKNGFKVLFIDVMDHPSYTKIPILTQANFSKWNKGIVRIIQRPDDVVKLVDLINESPHLNNTFIVFEDPGKYTEKNLPKPFKRLIAETKQRNIDIVFMYHCWMDTPSDIFRKGIDYIQLFKTEDSPKSRKENLRLYDKILAVYDEVKTNPAPFYGKYIDTRTN